MFKYYSCLLKQLFIFSQKSLAFFRSDFAQVRSTYCPEQQIKPTINFICAKRFAETIVTCPIALNPDYHSILTPDLVMHISRLFKKQRIQSCNSIDITRPHSKDDLFILTNYFLHLISAESIHILFLWKDDIFRAVFCIDCFKINIFETTHFFKFSPHRPDNIIISAYRIYKP